MKNVRRKVQAFAHRGAGEMWTVEYIRQWNIEQPPEVALGGATGGSPVEVWRKIWEVPALEEFRKLRSRRIAFLDEYFGPFPSYHHWAYRNLRVDHGGFLRENIFVPRGCFFEDGRVVTCARLDQILAATPEQWTTCTEAGEDGNPPEIRIKRDATHPVLCEIRDRMASYDRFVRSLIGRLQILGLGVKGHLAFVERGAAAPDTNVMLVRLASSTKLANEGDFNLRGLKGDDASLEPAHYAITQGIGTILSAGELLLLAWGGSKREAFARMFREEAGPQNPAGWIQKHDNVTVVCDTEAFGDLREEEIAERGFRLAQ